jgi:hypothetical protein
MADAARSMVGITGSEQLSIVVEAAMRLVPAKSALLYAPTDGDGLEVVAAAGALRALVGGRATTESAMLGEVLRAGSARVVADFSRDAGGFPFAGCRSAAALPARDPGGSVRGVLLVLHTRPDAYRSEQLTALRPLALFASLALGVPQQRVAVAGAEVRPVVT